MRSLNYIIQIIQASLTQLRSHDQPRYNNRKGGNSMDDRNFELAEKVINPSYARLSQNSLNQRHKIMRELLSQRQLPEHPLDDLTIRFVLDNFAVMDSNNFEGKVGVGEREGRVFSSMVAERHHHMSHGIGRSGDIMANQPKAAGSSLMLELTRFLTVSALHQLNYEFVKEVLLLPTATGMSLSLVFLTLAGLRPKAKYVVWSRIDQKTCLKSIISANLQPIAVEPKLVGDHLETDLQAIDAAVQKVGAQNVLAVVSTTSCFAPRTPDNVPQMGLIARKHKVFHVVNNAYGIWCSKIAHGVGQALKLEKKKEKQQLMDSTAVVVQSTDKNFMVPVGGSFIFTNNPEVLTQISKKYPGRASASPVLDLFITLLSMGKSTIKAFKKQRKDCFKKMGELAASFALKHKCKVLSSPTNTISMAMHLTIPQIPPQQMTELGAILYSKRVMGHRVVAKAKGKTTIGGVLSFNNYGSHCEDYPNLPYVTFAAAVGSKEEEVRIFFARLDEAVAELKKKLKKKDKNFKQTKQETSQEPELQQTKAQQKKQEVSEVTKAQPLHPERKRQQIPSSE